MQNILGSVEVCMEDNSTDFASEDRALPLPSSQASTDRTGFGGVSCRNELDSNTELLSFVSEEALKLVERPIRKEPVLLLSMLGVPYPLQILQNDYSVSSCTFNQLLANAVVHIPHKPLLDARDFLQMSSGASSAFGLQSTTQVNITMFDFPDVGAIIEPSIGSGNQIVDSSINPDCSSNLFGFDGRFLDGDHKPEFAILASDKVAFFGLPSNELLEVIGNCNLDFGSSFGCENTSDSFTQIDSTASRIIVNSLTLEDGFLSLPLYGSLHRSTGIFVGDDSELSRKSEVLSELPVSLVMHPEGVGVFMFVTGINDRVLSQRHLIECFINSNPLCFIFNHYRLDGFHHIHTYNNKVFKVIGTKKNTRNSSSD